MGSQIRSPPALIPTPAPITRDEITAIVLLWVAVAGVVWLQLGLARATRSRLGGLTVIVLFFFVLPALAIFAVYPFLPREPDPAQIVAIAASAALWIASAMVMSVAEGREQRRIGMGKPGPLPRIIRVRRSDWIVIVALATAVAVPRVVAAAVVTRPCVDVEARLAARQPGLIEREPSAWMPGSPPAGGQVVAAGPMAIDDVVASRVDGEDGRAALIAAGFQDAHHVRIAGPDGPAEVTAQRFATQDGALAFDAYATRYACVFATDTSAGPNDGVGLAIRYGDATNPYGDQVAWIDGRTRILAWVGGATPITEHQRLDDLVATVP